VARTRPAFTRGGTCAVNTGAAGGTELVDQHTFKPGATGTRSATLSVGTNANAVTLTLTGTGTTKPGKGK
jgi:hypothetical protein